jgi:hypothetical protein
VGQNDTRAVAVLFFHPTERANSLLFAGVSVKLTGLDTGKCIA